jgi:peptide/nickel transport system permease protein
MFSAAVLLFGLLTLIFFISHASPGDPVRAILPPNVSSAVADELRNQFGLNESVTVQYLRWIQNAVMGNLGYSFRHQQSVSEVIRDFLPNTMMLAFTAIIIEILAGIILGYLAFRYYRTTFDTFLSNFCLILYTLPSFWIGYLLLAAFAVALGFFPLSQMYSVESENLSLAGKFSDIAAHLVLPACTIAIPGAAGIARFFRSSLLQTSREEYVIFAKSFGLPNRKIFFFFQTPNAIASVITFIGLEIGTLLTGAIVTETIFGWPGMGRLAVQAIFARDYPLIMGCTLASGIVVILGNFIADVAYMFIDPRVRLTS